MIIKRPSIIFTFLHICPYSSFPSIPSLIVPIPSHFSSPSPPLLTITFPHRFLITCKRCFGAANAICSKIFPENSSFRIFNGNELEFCRLFPSDKLVKTSLKAIDFIDFSRCSLKLFSLRKIHGKIAKYYKTVK